MSRPLRATLLLVAVLAGGCSADAAPGAAVPDPGATPSSDPPSPVQSGPPTSPSPSPSPRTSASRIGGSGFVVWARGGLPIDLATAAGALPGVASATVVPSGTLGLTGARRADGTVVDRVPDGWRIPVDVAAVDPASYAATLPAEARATVAALRPGEVLLSAGSATRRRLEPGDVLDLEGRPGLTVAGVLPDAAGTWVEILLHRDDAAAAGLEPDGTLFVETHLAPGPARDDLSTALAALVPEETVARVVDLVDTRRERRRAPLVLSLAQVKDRFGEFAYRPLPGERAVEIDPAWVAANIVDADVPILGTVRCHRGIVEPLRAALGSLVDAGLADLIDAPRYAGCFNARRIAVDGERLSRHAWGIALDVNVDLSLPGGGEVPDPAVIEAFAAQGFVWGGEFIVPDNHHFEWVGSQWPLVSGDADEP